VGKRGFSACFRSLGRLVGIAIPECESTTGCTGTSGDFGQSGGGRIRDTRTALSRQSGARRRRPFNRAATTSAKRSHPSIAVLSTSRPQILLFFPETLSGEGKQFRGRRCFCVTPSLLCRLFFRVLTLLRPPGEEVVKSGMRGAPAFFPRCSKSMVSQHSEVRCTAGKKSI